MASSAAQRVVLITAGSAGLGAACARAFAPDFRVVINYASNTDRANALLKELSAIPCTNPSPTAPRFHSIRADVGQKDQVTRLVQDTISHMGRLDIVVSNVGWTRVTNFSNFSEGLEDADWDKCFIYNVKTHLWLMAACRDALSATQGAFISTASVAGVKPAGSSLPYAVTKAAQIHLVKSLAVICGADGGIRVNCVSPGLMLTEWGLNFSEEQREMARRRTVLGKLTGVEDVANQVRTIALSETMTGQNVVVDSGFSL